MKIPKIDPKVTQQTTSTGGVEMDPGRASTGGQIVESIGVGLQGIGEQLEKAQTLAETTEAQNFYDVETAKIEAEALADPDSSVDNLRKYTERIDKIKDKAVSNLSIPVYRDRFGSDINRLSTISKIKLAGSFRTKSIDKSKAASDLYLYNQKQGFMRATSPAEAQMFVVNRDKKIQEMVDAGHITAEEGMTRMLKEKAEWNKDRGYYEAEKNPAAVMAEIAKGDKGDYADMDATDRADVGKHAQRMLKKQETEAKAAQAKKYDDNLRTAMIDMLDGNLPYSELQRRYRAGDLDEGDYNTLERKLVTPDYEIMRGLAQSDPAVFSSLRESISSRSMTQGQLDRQISASLADKTLLPQDAKYLMKLVQEIPPTREDELTIAGANNIRDWAKSQIKMNWWESLTDKEKADRETEQLVADFHRRVDSQKLSGDAITEAAKQVKSDYIKKRFPEVADLEDVPHISIGIGGKINKLFSPTEKTSLKPMYTITRNAQQAKPKKDSAKK